MNRTDRLLAIVLELQGKGRQRAEDLARTFETSKRTIYRDIQALCESGVPVVSIPGLGYSLMEGYFLPPLSFSTSEATMLLLGSDLMAQYFDAQYREAASAAARKISSVLPQELRAEVGYLQDNIIFVTPNAHGSLEEQGKLQLLRRAILDRRRVSFTYHQRTNPESGQNVVTPRQADPYRLVSLYGIWNLIAYCHLRQDRRHFRLDRMEELQLCPNTFERPAELANPPAPSEAPRSIAVRVLFPAEVARWLRETPNYYMTSSEETAEGLLVTLHVRHERDILQWLLSWGRQVRVLEPASLRQRLAEEARAMLCNAE
ncbi:transcriptional regulator [Ktedonobacter sp. SOSP1-52]|uniref:helix-turn-helix transcriptional regulator n=1 Tax=Ktedonobacter sp. SOSP1-52 TaxID=2778366 RepID=UPI0019162FFA|nr:YafY family protein [Ktedonobacter sp. SOSP1-52]GHO68958.1 transcriptional regulator [Ktedonobacter sp. SOSP1-52]